MPGMWYPCDCSQCHGVGGVAHNGVSVSESQVHLDKWLDHVNEDDPEISAAPQLIHGYLSFNNSQVPTGSIGYTQYPMGYAYPYQYPPQLPPGYINTEALNDFKTKEYDEDDGQPIKGVLCLTNGHNNSVGDSGKFDSNDDFGSKDEYSPGGSEDINLQDGKRKDGDSLLKKSKYSTAELKPDSTLPPVIRRRNRNRRKQLAEVKS